MRNKLTLKITYSAICLALALVLPFITSQIPQIGKMLCPMHLPVFLCGFLCGWPYGLVIGFITPILRSFIFGFPVIFPDAVGMAFELAVYGLASGILYKVLPKKIGYTYLSLFIAMIAGRVSYAMAHTFISGVWHTNFGFEIFLTKAVVNTIPGIITQFILIPLILLAMKNARLIPNE